MVEGATFGVPWNEGQEVSAFLPIIEGLEPFIVEVALISHIASLLKGESLDSRVRFTLNSGERLVSRGPKTVELSIVVVLFEDLLPVDASVVEVEPVNIGACLIVSINGDQVVVVSGVISLEHGGLNESVEGISIVVVRIASNIVSGVSWGIDNRVEIGNQFHVLHLELLLQDSDIEVIA